MNVKSTVKAACLLTILIGVILPGMLHGKEFQVLVVMSYDEGYAWANEIKEGVDSVLAKNSTVTYFWMDTKRYLDRGKEKAEEAYELYRKLRPDGVIAADDNAQSMFVEPYLKNRVSTPVMFCGVNAQPEEYGYPAKNVSGILERLHIRNSIIYAQLLIPSIKKMIFITKESPSGEAVFRQYQSEHDTYPVESVSFFLPKNIDEAITAVMEFKERSDALFYETMEGIRDKNGTIMGDREVVPILAKAYGKPLISNNLYHVQYGTLCAVIKTGQEQGATAAEMLLKAMQGTPVSRIPMTRNRHGKRVINLGVMNALSIKPGSEALKDVLLVGIGEAD